MPIISNKDKFIAEKLEEIEESNKNTVQIFTKHIDSLNKDNRFDLNLYYVSKI